MDSGASDTMFISKKVFKDYKLVTPHTGDSGNIKSMGRNEKLLIPVPFIHQHLTPI
jgi:hypothetical protein